MNSIAHRARSNALTMAVLMAGTFIFVLDFFIVNVAIPSTQADLHASDSQIQLVVATYAIAISSLLILGGRLGDLFGRRRVFMAGLAIFTASSALCGSAPGIGLLLVGRALQGVGAALFAPQVLSIIGVTFEGDERRRAVTTYGLTMGLAAAGGQLIGGALIALNVLGLDWRTCYLVNVPIGIAALVVTPRAIAESRAEGHERLDFLGAALAGATLVAIVLPLVEGRREGWPAWTFACLGAALPLALAFALRQRRLAATGGSPLVHPALFRERSFTVGVLTSVVFYAGMASFFLVLAVYLQEGCGLSALDSGLVFTALAPGYLVASAGAETLAPRFGRQVLAAGGLIRATALTGLALTVAAIGTGGSPLLLVPALAVDGIGMGFLTAPLVGRGRRRDGPAPRGRRLRRPLHRAAGRQHDRRRRDRRDLLRRDRPGRRFRGRLRARPGRRGGRLHRGRGPGPAASGAAGAGAGRRASATGTRLRGAAVR